MPIGYWFVWLIMAGRGWGKTRTAVEAISSMLRGPTPFIAPAGAPAVMSIIADTPFDMREYCIEGLSGFRNVGPDDYRPTHYPSRRLLVWPNGCRALLFSAEDPETLRGASGSLFWWDELGKAKKAKMGWMNLMFGMREQNPRGIVTTTPRPPARTEGGEVLRDLVKRKSVIVTSGSTYENKSNLSPVYYREVIVPAEGTRMARQEIHGELLGDLPGALWDNEILESARRDDNGDKITDDMIPPLLRIVIGVDPSGARNQHDDSHDEIGIIAAGIDVKQRIWVLEDWSLRDTPLRWARQAIRLYQLLKADLIVGEENFGGALVEANLRAVDRKVSYRHVHASRGKVVRAEPISSMYEKGEIKHAKDLFELEDQMIKFTTTGFAGKGSPDKVDALVWACTELVRKKPNRPMKGRAA